VATVKRDQGMRPTSPAGHVQHVYTKVGGSTRAAAAMFAMKHGLLGD
jgi:DNA-binding CsgD family transcriptional regulator